MEGVRISQRKSEKSVKVGHSITNNITNSLANITNSLTNITYILV